jgi:sulfur-oxidizing protein SoxB
VRGPYEARLNERLGVTEGLLYRRGNFNGTFDQLILDALMEVKGAQIAFTNAGGLRLNQDIPAGSAITLRDVEELLPYPNEQRLTSMPRALITT